MNNTEFTFCYCFAICMLCLIGWVVMSIDCFGDEYDKFKRCKTCKRRAKCKERYDELGWNWP